jgi:hypothetical protein
MTGGVSGRNPRCGRYATTARRITYLRRQFCDPFERYNYDATGSFLKLSEYAAEEERLRKLYDQARAQGNKKKKKEYKEKIAELNRLRKSDQRASNRSKANTT